MSTLIGLLQVKYKDNNFENKLKIIEQSNDPIAFLHDNTKLEELLGINYKIAQNILLHAVKLINQNKNSQTDNDKKSLSKCKSEPGFS
jgi:hypothetical protein